MQRLLHAQHTLRCYLARDNTALQDSASHAAHDRPARATSASHDLRVEV